MLEVDELAVELGGKRIVDAISFTIPVGRTLSVLGPSGAGKTTLLRALAGLEPLHMGEIRWNGRRIDRIPIHQRGVGLVFQDYVLFPHRNVRQNVAFGLRMQGLSRSDTSQRTTEVLELVGLGGFEERSIDGLSGGEQQRVALARALAPAPDLLLLDEPLGSLDYDLRQRLLAELGELLGRLDVTSIFVTHDQQEAFAVADQVLIIRQGRIAQAGSPVTVWQAPADEWVARFVGFTNVTDTSIEAGVATTGWGPISMGDAPDGEYRLALRPESVTVSPSGLPGRVVSVAFRGGKWVVHARAGDSDITAIAAARPDGEQIRLAIDTAGAVLFDLSKS